MRATLYAVKVKGSARWTVRYSIAWDVDASWWLGGEGKLIVRLADTLPLGVAELACARARLELDKQNEQGVREVQALLCRIAKMAWEEEGGGGDSVVGELEAESVVKGDTYRRDRVSSRRIAELAREASARLSGRALLEEEALQLLAAAPGGADAAACFAALQHAMLAGAVRLVAAVAPQGAAEPRSRWGWLRKRRSAAHRCRRCGSGIEHLRRTPCAACGGHACAYCEACLTMGRSRACGLLVIGAAPRDAVAPPLAPAASSLDRWQLSPAQREAAAAALRFLAGEREAEAGQSARGAARQSVHHPARQSLHVSAHEFIRRPTQLSAIDSAQQSAQQSARPARRFLLWAVTGAGKTEMIFPLLEAVLSRGGRALVATPRRDVVLELAPRLAAAFPDYSRSTLYGGSADRWENSALTLATTHQLIRFQAAFDLVLIDEMDAFPYKDDKMLQYAACKCCKPTGATLFLSATPPPAMQREVAFRRLPSARVPVRYHGHPLPVPRRITLPTLTRWIQLGRIPKIIVNSLKQSIQRGAQIFLFVPMIRHVEPLVILLRRMFAILGLHHSAQIDGTSSKDSLREDKVSRFRDRSIRILVTTTILERGVTIPKSDVFVFDADDPLFDTASLVQMAGRAGRSASDPNGIVVFGARRLTASQRGAIRQIRGMNRIAARQGYTKHLI